MIFTLISFLAGILTVLAPCILPLLPIIISSTEGSKKGVSRRALIVIGSLALSVVIFTVLLKASTLLIDIPQWFWAGFSGTVVMIVGLSMIFPTTWAKLPLIKNISRASNASLGKGYQKKSYAGDVLIGLSLGPVFSTCSPTYLFIIATALPAGIVTGFIYLLAFVAGLVVSLLAIAYFGEQLVTRLTKNPEKSEKIKKTFGILLFAVGILIFTGYDKKLETGILDLGYGATINFEETLIDRFAP
jgi:cytochrome c biogenesis protein CcdA